jgi:hypothetical protein
MADMLQNCQDQDARKESLKKSCRTVSQQTCNTLFLFMSAAVIIYLPKIKHSAVIGKGGATIREIQDLYHVRVTIPRSDEDSHAISITPNLVGTPVTPPDATSNAM